MRKTILSAIAICPMLLQAQVIPPAQPKSAVTNPVLMSRLMNSPTYGALFEGAAIPERTRVTFTGLTEPKLLQPEAVNETVDWHWQSNELERLAVVSMVVGRSGTPYEVHMVRSLGPGLDKDVLASVSRYHFQPATLNNESVPVKLELTIKIKNKVQ